MRPSRWVLSTVAMVASFFVFAALGSAPPAEKASSTGEGARLHAAAGSCCAGEAADETASASPADPLLALLIQEAQNDEASGPADQLTPEQTAKGVATRKALLAQLMALMDVGRADCCNEPGCGFCLIAADKCVCGPNLTKGEPVCPECWGGWQAGHGMIPNIKPEDVKVLPKKELRELYDLRATKIDEAANAK